MIRTGIKLDLDVGDLVSNAGRAKGAINTITEAMKKAEDEGRLDDYGKLAYEKEKMQSRATGFDRDVRMLSSNPRLQGTGVNGQPVFKIDQEYAILIRTQTEAIKRLTATYDALMKGGDIDSAMALSPQITKQQDDFHDLIEEINGVKGAKSDGVGEAVKSIALNQIVGAIKSGLDVWVSSIDRTAIINSAGGGDVLGASLAERQRRTDRTTGVLNTAGAAAQGIGLALAPFTSGISLLVGTSVNLLTQFAASHEAADKNKYANRIAYSSLWDDKKEQAMSLAAFKGTPDKIRESWKEAADTGEKYGYSAEESAELIRQALSQGVGRDKADQVFDYERRTGADRGALSSLAFMSERYGGGDALRAAWRGLNASGMKSGQYNEYLRAMQKSVEEGIAKGYVRSSEQVARNMTMLAYLTNDNPLWKGEQGAQRLSKMNTGLESAVGLQSTSDIIAFRAAKRVLGSGARYEDVLALMERGISDGTIQEGQTESNGTRFMREIMNVSKESESGDRSGMIEVLRDVFKFNYNEAISFLNSWETNKGMVSDAGLNAITDEKAVALPEAGREIPELKAAIETMEVQNLVIRAGQGFWDTEFGKAIQETRKVYQETTGNLLPGAGNTDAPEPRGLPNAADIPFNIREKIPEMEGMVTTVLPGYFGHGGDTRGDRTAKDRLERMFDASLRSNDDSQLYAAFNSMNILNNLRDSVGSRWDKEDKLNTIAGSGTAVELLAALKQLIEIEEEIRDSNNKGVNVEFAD